MKLRLRNRTLDLGARVHLMGILNVTPDSFSDGGALETLDEVVRQAVRLEEAGADLLDVGGESTRPGAEPVSEHEELRRVIPAIRAIRERSAIPLSIDTTKARVANEALRAGADLVNDISACRFDPGMAGVALEWGCPVILMHMQGNGPRDMQAAPCYDDVVSETLAFLRERVEWLMGQGVPRERILIDPGIGFGKTVGHNLSILKHLDRYHELGLPVLVGHSRKSFIGRILDRDVRDREIGTAVLSALCAAKGAAILRVHDVAASAQAIRVAAALQDAA